MSGSRPAGELLAWLGQLDVSRHDGRGMDVPCDGCTACCRSRQFIHVEPDETAAIARIPRRLLVQAPGLPRGHLLLGYDQRGHCPMLVDDRCSIYEHRPRACRAYDCRIYAAAGVDPGDDKPEVAQRVREWRFSHSGTESRAAGEAIRAGAEFLVAEPEALPRPGANNTQLALAAIALRELFVDGSEPQVEDVRVRLTSAAR